MSMGIGVAGAAGRYGSYGRFVQITDIKKDNDKYYISIDRNKYSENLTCIQQHSKDPYVVQNKDFIAELFSIKNKTLAEPKNTIEKVTVFINQLNAFKQELKEPEQKVIREFIKEIAELKQLIETNPVKALEKNDTLVKKLNGDPAKNNVSAAEIEWDYGQ